MRAIGQIKTTGSTAKVAVSKTTYTEPTSGAQRSLVSSSSNDAAAGSGAQSVRITYYTLASDGTIAGPFVEVVTLNGTAPVATVNTDIALIEKLEVVTAGSGGVAAGDISLNTKSDGTGTEIVKIAQGDVATQMGHHYVPSGRRCHVTDIQALGGDSAVDTVELLQAPYPALVEQSVSGPIATTSTLPRDVRFADVPNAPIFGPARLRLMVTPGDTVNPQTHYASFGYFEQ